MGKPHSPGFSFGMVVSLVLGMGTAVILWRLFGASANFLTYVVGFLVAGVWWALLRPLFFVLGALPGYVASPIRREFKHAWRVLGCKRRLQGPDVRRLWQDATCERLPFYSAIASPIFSTRESPTNSSISSTHGRTPGLLSSAQSARANVWSSCE